MDMRGCLESASNNRSFSKNVMLNSPELVRLCYIYASDYKKTVDTLKTAWIQAKQEGR